MKRFLGSTIVLILSFLWGVVTFQTFLVEEYSLFEEWLQIDQYLDQSLWHSSWVFSIVLVIILCWKTIKWMTVDYWYHFFHWFMVMLLFSYPLIYNRGWYWFYTGFVFGLPALGFNYLYNGFKTERLFIHKRKSVFVFVVVFLIGGYSEYRNTHWSQWSNSEYEFNVNTYTIPTFLDWQIEADIEIVDRKTGHQFKGDFWFGNGPYFSICKDSLSEFIFYLKGLKYNDGHDWKINMETNEIQQYYNLDTNDLSKEIVIHDSSFNLIPQ